MTTATLTPPFYTRACLVNGEPAYCRYYRTSADAEAAAERYRGTVTETITGRIWRVDVADAPR